MTRLWVKQVVGMRLAYRQLVSGLVLSDKTLIQISKRQKHVRHKYYKNRT